MAFHDPQCIHIMFTCFKIRSCIAFILPKSQKNKIPSSIPASEIECLPESWLSVSFSSMPSSTNSHRPEVTLLPLVRMKNVNYLKFHLQPYIFIFRLL